MQSILVAATAALLALSGCGHAQQVPSPASPRPLILVVHGRGQLGRDTASLRRSWISTLNGTVNLLAGDTLVRNSDLRLVWYADVLDPGSDEACDYLESNTLSQKRWATRTQAQSLWDLARGALGAAVDFIEGNERLQARGFVGDLLFLADLRKRCGAERRLERALNDAAVQHRPVVLVAHSLGSLMAYDYLNGWAPRPDSAADIRRVITVGSLLGIGEVDALLFDGALRMPSSIHSWINIHDPDDPLSAPLRSTMTRRDGDELSDLAVDVPGGVDAHEITSYLRQPATARAILTPWCAAFGTSAPAACARLH